MNIQAINIGSNYYAINMSSTTVIYGECVEKLERKDNKNYITLVVQEEDLIKEERVYPEDVYTNAQPAINALEDKFNSKHTEDSAEIYNLVNKYS